MSSFAEQSDCVYDSTTLAGATGETGTCHLVQGKCHGMPEPVSASMPLLRFGFLKRFVQPPMNESKI